MSEVIHHTDSTISTMSGRDDLRTVLRRGDTDASPLLMPHELKHLMSMRKSKWTDGARGGSAQGGAADAVVRLAGPMPAHLRFDQVFDVNLMAEVLKFADVPTIFLFGGTSSAAREMTVSSQLFWFIYERETILPRRVGPLSRHNGPMTFDCFYLSEKSNLSRYPLNYFKNGRDHFTNCDAALWKQFLIVNRCLALELQKQADVYAPLSPITFRQLAVRRGVMELENFAKGDRHESPALEARATEFISSLGMKCFCPFHYSELELVTPVQFDPKVDYFDRVVRPSVRARMSSIWSNDDAERLHELEKKVSLAYVTILECGPELNEMSLRAYRASLIAEAYDETMMPRCKALTPTPPSAAANPGYVPPPPPQVLHNSPAPFDRDGIEAQLFCPVKRRRLFTKREPLMEMLRARVGRTTELSLKRMRSSSSGGASGGSSSADAGNAADSDDNEKVADVLRYGEEDNVEEFRDPILKRARRRR